MRSADQLDDLWERGLTALADPPEFSPEARERVVVRAAKHRRDRMLSRAVAVVAIAAIAFGAFAVIATRGKDEPSFTTVPTTAPQHIDVLYLGDDVLDVSPRDVAPGPVTVSFETANWHGPKPLTLGLPGGAVTDANGDGSFVAAEHAHYDLIARSDETTIASASLDVFPPYVAPSGAPVASVEITALPSLKDEPDIVHVPAGVVEISLRNEAAGQHTITIDGKPGFMLEVNAAGEVDRGKVELAPGEYHFSCSVPGHREAGEEGTLFVEDK